MKCPHCGQETDGADFSKETKNIKSRTYLRQAAGAVLLAGIIMLLIGTYYCVVKAGIPYQDPPPEIQMQYAVNMGIGKMLIKTGFLVSLCAGIARLIIRWTERT